MSVNLLADPAQYGFMCSFRSHQGSPPLSLSSDQLTARLAAFFMESLACPSVST